MPCIGIKESGLTISSVVFIESLTKRESLLVLTDNVSTTKLSDTLNNVSAVCGNMLELKNKDVIKIYFIISYNNEIIQY